MQALDGLFKEDMKHEKQKRLEERKKRLSEMLLKETKEFEVTGTKQITIYQKIMNLRFHIIEIERKLSIYLWNGNVIIAIVIAILSNCNFLPEENCQGFNGIQTHGPFISAAELYQLSYDHISISSLFLQFKSPFHISFLPRVKKKLIHWSATNIHGSS